MTNMTIANKSVDAKVDVPKDRLEGLKQNWKTDLVSGFILFLIALPLSLGIAIASGVPPMAGVIAACVGGIFVSQVSGSYVTINGPAAGLIVVILASVTRLGGDQAGYHGTLAAILTAGLILFVLGLLKAGELGAFFPNTVVHGMLASIGIIIMAKQFPLMLGVKPPKEPLEIIASLPSLVMQLNPEVALIGGISLLLMILFSLIKNPKLKRVPAPLVVVGLAIGMGLMFDFEHTHQYVLSGQQFKIDSAKTLVALPTNLMDAFQFPDFSQVASMAFWWSVISITFVQGIETLLSCAAVDKLDPYKRKADLSRDVGAVGLGSSISAALGGLPMIAEIVRSTANVMNGARTRWSNFFHGTCLLLFVALASQVIDMIPLAALAAILVFTGFRLASPRVFKSIHDIGPEQTLLFVVTIVATLKTDLMVGVMIGVLTKFVLHLIRGVSPASLFKVNATLDQTESNAKIAIKSPAVFSNYLSLRTILKKVDKSKPVEIDMSACRFVDHSVMEHLHEFEKECHENGGQFKLTGLERHKASSAHPLAARRLAS